MKQTNTVKKHEEVYIHIKKESLKACGSFLIGLFFLGLSYFNLKLIIYKWNDLGLSTDLVSWIQLDIIPNILIECILILFGIIFLFNLYNKINWKEFLSVFITVLSAGLMGGLIIGLIIGLMGELMGGLIIGLIAGLIAGLITGLIIGLENEFWCI